MYTNRCRAEWYEPNLVENFFVIKLTCLAQTDNTVQVLYSETILELEPYWYYTQSIDSTHTYLRNAE